MKSYDSLTGALTELKGLGYEADFDTQHFCLYCGDLDLRLDPDQFHVDDLYKVVENPGSDDVTLLYAISSSNGVKGTLVDHPDIPGRDH